MREADALLALAEGLVRAGRAQGADAVEAYLAEETEVRAAYHNGLPSSRAFTRLGLGIRWAAAGRVGQASGYVADAADGERILRRAAYAARLGGPRPDFPGFAPDGRTVAPALRATAFPLAPEDAASEARRMVDAVAAHPTVNFYALAYGHARTRIAVANSEGTLAGDVNEHSFASMEVRSRGTTDRSSIQYRETARPEPAAELLDAFATEVEGLHRTVPFDRATVDLVADPQVASRFLPYLVYALSADLVRTGASRYKDRRGQPTFAPTLGVMDDPSVAGKGRLVDDEGVATRSVPLVERGVLRDYLRNYAESRRAGVAPAGQGFRGGRRISMPPASNAANLTVAEGARTLDALVADTDRGVLVRYDLLAWLLMLSPTGNFSSVAPVAYLIERGEIRGPLAPATVGGNAYDSMADPRFEAGRPVERAPPGSTPPVRVPRVAVSA